MLKSQALVASELSRPDTPSAATLVHVGSYQLAALDSWKVQQFAALPLQGPQQYPYSRAGTAPAASRGNHPVPQPTVALSLHRPATAAASAAFAQEHTSPLYIKPRRWQSSVLKDERVRLKATRSGPSYEPRFVATPGADTQGQDSLSSSLVQSPPMSNGSGASHRVQLPSSIQGPGAAVSSLQPRCHGQLAAGPSTCLDGPRGGGGLQAMRPQQQQSSASAMPEARSAQRISQATSAARPGAAAASPAAAAAAHGSPLQKGASTASALVKQSGAPSAQSQRAATAPAAASRPRHSLSLLSHDSLMVQLDAALARRGLHSPTSHSPHLSNLVTLSLTPIPMS